MQKKPSVKTLRRSLLNQFLRYSACIYIMHIYFCYAYIFFRFTLYPAYVNKYNHFHAVSRIQRGVLNSGGIRFKWRDSTPCLASSPEQRNENTEYFTAPRLYSINIIISPNGNWPIAFTVTHVFTYLNYFHFFNLENQHAARNINQI